MKNIKEVLSPSQRNKKSLIMKRNAHKIKIAKKRNAKRMASPEKLKQKARRAAVEVLKAKLSKKMGAGEELTNSQKQKLEAFVAKNKTKIDKLAKRLMKKTKEKEIERLKNANK